jgi:phage terminase large subunit
MLTFVRNEKGKPEAQEGKHDDCIMATAIAYHARSQQSYYMEADIIEDDIDDDDMEYQKGGWFD